MSTQLHSPMTLRAAQHLPDPAKRGKRNPPWVLIHRAADRRMTRIARTIVSAARAAQESVDVAEIEAALETGIASYVTDVVGRGIAMLEAKLKKPLQDALFVTEQDAAEAVLRDAQRYGRFRVAQTFDDLAFDLVNPEATAWASTLSSQLITNINDDARTNTQALIAAAFDEGVPIPQTARMLRNQIGLTPQYRGAVDNLRRAILASPGKKIWAGKTAIRVPKLGADAAFLERRVGRYAQRLLNVRAKTIARTEAISAANQGQLLVWKQAKAKGLLFGDELKEWIVTPDDRLCAICEPLDGEAVPLDQAFSIGQDSPPAHPSCRCTMGLADPADYVCQSPCRPTPTGHQDFDVERDDVAVPINDVGVPEGEWVQTQDKVLRKIFDEDEKLKNAAVAYIGEDFSAMNTFLRTKKGTKEIKGLVKDFKKAVVKIGKSAPLADDTILYRGLNSVGAKAIKKLGLKEGATLELPGFQSTSLFPSVATGFTSQRAGMMFEIKSKFGAYIEFASGSGGAEVVLLPGTKFRVDKIGKSVFYNERIGKEVLMDVVQLTVIDPGI